MAYIDTPFDTDLIRVRSVQTLMKRVTIAQAYSGKTERNEHWSNPLARYVIDMNTLTGVQRDYLVNYWLALGGPADSFPLEDWNDFQSVAKGSTPASSDQTLGTATAGQTDFQLIKNYTVGTATRTRKITRPQSGTVLVEKDSVLQTLTTDYTIEPLGIIRFVVAMTGGEVIKAGYKFHVPVFFINNDIDVLAASINDDDLITDATLELWEDRE